MKGYKTIITLPEKMSPEKVAVLRALNATIIRTPTQAAHDSPESHIGVANRLQKEIPNAHILDQYGNKDNPLAHEYGTAEEIWTQTKGQIKAVVAGAGTGGTITGLSRGLRKHNPAVKVIAADPHGSVLAVPAKLNEEHANVSYKVEGIGYDFVPDVLDQQAVNKWYKTDDREAFAYARRLIAEEGLLVGGSSGSAMAALVHAAQDHEIKDDDVVVVILPDSIRSYLSKVESPCIQTRPIRLDHTSNASLKFVDDDWLAANDLLPPTPPTTAPSSPKFSTRRSSMDAVQGATVGSLRLKHVTSVLMDSHCSSAIETKLEKGFDQLPVLAPNGGRLVGLVTLGNLLSYISQGRAQGDSPVSEVMFDFRKISEQVRHPYDFSDLRKALPRTQNVKKSAIINGGTDGGNGNDGNGNGGVQTKPGPDGGPQHAPPRRHEFVEITMDTPLSVLSRFLEWNSAAIVTQKDDARSRHEQKVLKPVAVVTKVDVLTYLMRHDKS